MHRRHPDRRYHDQCAGLVRPVGKACALHAGNPDRKSTRLNSSHQIISYAVFCLKKKKTMLMRLCTIRAQVWVAIAVTGKGSGRGALLGNVGGVTHGRTAAAHTSSAAATSVALVT